MNINTLLGSSTSGLAGSTTNTSTNASQAAATAAVGAPYLAKATQRIQSDVDTTNAQLSKLGLLKSALASAQLSAKALSGLGGAVSASDVTNALGGFFKTYNAAVNAANTAASAAGPTLASSNARRVVQDLKAALRAEPATTAALKKLGLSVQSDGTLAQDANKFASALAADPSGVRAALALVGKQVDGVNSRELASNGPVDTALANLNQHSTVLTAQQNAMKTMQAALAAYQANASQS